MDPIALHKYLHSTSYGLHELDVVSRKSKGRSMKQAAISYLRMKIDHLVYDDVVCDDGASVDPPERGSLLSLIHI